jgi:Rieske Fe-S protein
MDSPDEQDASAEVSEQLNAETGAESQQATDRRSFLASTSTLVMAGGLIAGYGTFLAWVGRFVYPAAGEPRAWLFLSRCDAITDDSPREYTSPAGEKVVIARQGDGNTADDFVALSSVCPHLGCQVHWEAHNDRFFCPCHNGVFDPQGNPVSGPPKQGNQKLKHYPLSVEHGLLFIEVPSTSIVSAEGPTFGDSFVAQHVDTDRPLVSREA